MNESFGKRQPLSTEIASLDENTQRLDTLIADLEARIENGTHIPEDARLLEKYKMERESL